MGPHHKEDLAIIVVYDSREDGNPEILSGARKHIAHDGTVHYTIVQDLANQRFAIDHRQPYAGSAQGQVEIVIEPQSGGVRGVVRSRDMNLINYNGPPTSCTFNTAPVPPLGLK